MLGGGMALKGGANVGGMALKGDASVGGYGT